MTADPTGESSLPAPGPAVHVRSTTELVATDLHVDFRSRGRTARAVDGVHLVLRAGEIVALVGESGSGKTTVGRALLGLVRPTAGTLTRDGVPLGRSTAALRRHRRTVQLVLQDPTGALNPRQSVFDAVAEGLRVHKIGDVRRRVHEALERVGLRTADRFAHRFPHELSGGQRQRVVIAGALVLEPEVIIADEPVASLDASVRGEILALLLRLRDELGLGALVVTHDLGVAWNIADRIAVMYLGRIVESGPVEQVLTHPRHPYTRALLDALPHRALEGHAPQPLPGEMPDPTAIPAGCRFHPRCPALASGAADAVADRCRGVPLEVLPATLEHVAACHLDDHLTTP
jgi:peptide/nickel transport system ATP-binding protein